MTLLDATSRTHAELAGSADPLLRPKWPADHPYSWAKRLLGSWRWTTRADWVRHLHDSEGPNWIKLAEESGASLVKSNDGRQVWRVQLDGRLVFAKLYFPPRGWLRVRRWLLGSDSSRERRVAEYARQHRIAAVQPIASADGPANGSSPVSILITEGLPNARPLNEIWSALDRNGSRSRELKNVIVDRVARLVAHAHQNGFEHTDLHAGNILLDVLANGDYQALFVDLHNIRTSRPVSDRAVIRNLAQFHQWFRSRAPLTDRLRFLERYLHWRAAFEATGAFGRRLDCERRQLHRAIEQAVRAHANLLYAQRDRRVTRSGRYFARLDLGSGWRGHAFLRCKQPVAGSLASSMSFTAQQWRDWLKDPLQWLEAQFSKYAIKQSASGTVLRSCLPLESKPVDVICKRSTPRHLGKRIKDVFRRSRAMRTWRLGNALLNRQIPTARPLAVLEQRQYGILRDSLIITEYLEDAHDLDTVLTVQLRGMGAVGQRRLKRQISDSLAGVIRLFHARGFVHRDFKAPNVMVQWSPTGGDPPRILLVDLDGMRPRRNPTRRDWLRALARLNVSLDHCRRVSQADRLRCLKSCLIRPGHPAPEWRSTWAQIARLSEQLRTYKERQSARVMAKYGRV